MTPEQAGNVIGLLSDILAVLRFCFSAVAVGTGVTLAGFIVLLFTKH